MNSTLASALACLLTLTSGADAFATGFPATPEDLSGMAAMKCAGVLVRVKRGADQPAVVLTNGHCVTKHPIAAGDAIVNGTYEGGEIALFSGGLSSDGVKAAHVLYATTTDTDVALVELKTTYRDLQSKGAKVYEISETDAANGTDVGLVSGVSKQKQLCRISHIVPTLVEDTSTTTNVYAMKDLCPTKDGWFGTPMLDPASLKIVGILASANEDGKLCTEGNPCEMDDTGTKQAYEGRSYGERTSPIVNCLSIDGNIDVTLPDCTLTKPKLRGTPNPPAPKPTSHSSVWPRRK